MGYTTDFSGQFNVSPALKPEHMVYLAAFAETRRMKRNLHSRMGLFLLSCTL